MLSDAAGAGIAWTVPRITLSPLAGTFVVGLAIALAVDRAFWPDTNGCQH